MICSLAYLILQYISFFFHFISTHFFGFQDVQGRRLGTTWHDGHDLACTTIEMSRKRRAVPTTDDSDLDVGASSPLASSVSDGESSGSGSDQSFDISSALTQRRVALKKGKAPLVSHNDDTDDDTEFEEMIRNSISRRNVKDGTELLKNTKGKKKLAKGEVGGGSFQSMGITSLAISTTRLHLGFL